MEPNRSASEAKGEFSPPPRVAAVVASPKHAHHAQDADVIEAVAYATGVPAGRSSLSSGGLYVRDDPIVAKASTVWWPGGLHYYWPAPESLKAFFASKSAGLARARNRGHRRPISDPMAFPPIPRGDIIR
jgi:hypothetical protein